jgi:hypothetical protein
MRTRTLFLSLFVVGLSICMGGGSAFGQAPPPPAVVNIANLGILDHGEVVWISGTVSNAVPNSTVTIEVENTYSITLPGGQVVPVTQSKTWYNVPISSGVFSAPESFTFYGPGSYAVRAQYSHGPQNDTELSQVRAP